MKAYKNWASHEYSLGRRFLVMIPAGILIVLAIPYLFTLAANSIDSRLGLPRFTPIPWNWILAGLLAAAGLALGLWSIYAQVTIGRGTPVPMAPTQKLVVKPPFTYCRNPMTLGTFIAYLALPAWLGSWSALALVLTLTAALLLYIKLLEEKELEARFGQEYLEYKRTTPFFLPRLLKK